jgi:hypothetical protein
MAVNLVSLVMQFLTPDMIGRVAAALGLDRSPVQSAIGVAVPGLLAGLSGVATEPGGPQKLVDAAKRETGTLGRLEEMLCATECSVIGPSQLLPSLLGVREQNVLVDAVGRFAGLGRDKSSLLLGLLVHVVVGIIAQQQGNRGLGPSRIANLLASQKDNIAAAPAELSNLLSVTGLLNSRGGTARTTAAMSMRLESSSSSARRVTVTSDAISAISSLVSAAAARIASTTRSIWPPASRWTNFRAMFNLTKVAVPHIKKGSAIINTASINADDPDPTLLA